MTKRKKTNIKSKKGIFRLSIQRTNKNIFLQLIDDNLSQTLLSCSTTKFGNGSNIEAAKKLGESFSKILNDNKINQVIFDRGCYLYTGRVKALCDSLRNNGIQI